MSQFDAYPMPRVDDLIDRLHTSLLLIWLLASPPHQPSYGEDCFPPRLVCFNSLSCL